jgi:protein-tyrosine phosphatase
VALALMILDVPTAAISHDYLLTQEALAVEREARLAEIEEIGLTPEWGDCPADFVQRVQEHINTKYGGVEAYLDSIKFGAAERRRFIETLGA